MGAESIKKCLLLIKMKGEGLRWLGHPTTVTPTSKGQQHLLPLSSFPTTVNSYFHGLHLVILLTC